MRIVVQTDNGFWTVAEWAPAEDGGESRAWRGPAPTAISMLNAKCEGNAAGSALVSGLRRAMEDAEDVEAGRDPERPSEKAMRLVAEDAARRKGEHDERV